MHGEGSADGAVSETDAATDDWVEDDEFIVASRDEMTRNEWIFGLFDCDTSVSRDHILHKFSVDRLKLDNLTFNTTIRQL